MRSTESNDVFLDDADKGRMYSDSILERGDDMGDAKIVAACFADAPGRSARKSSSVRETSTGNIVEVWREATDACGSVGDGENVVCASADELELAHES